MEFKTAFTPDNQTIRPLLDGTIGLLETIFPHRIRAFYLTGSFAEGTAVANSDLDLIVVFKGTFQGDEADHLRQVRHHASKLSLIRLDLTPKNEVDLMAKGATGLKLAGKFLYGQDIRDQVPFEPLAQYRQDVMRGFFSYQREIRGDVEAPSLPVVYPDPDSEFYGYEKFGNWHGGECFTPGTRLLINLITLGATVSLTILHKARAGSKMQAITKYQRLIGDEWADWLAELYQLAKIELHYTLPLETAVRHQLRHLIQRTPDFENMILERCQPFWS